MKSKESDVSAYLLHYSKYTLYYVEVQQISGRDRFLALYVKKKQEHKGCCCNGILLRRNTWCRVLKNNRKRPYACKIGKQDFLARILAHLLL